MTNGRPIRFLAAVVVGWASVRTALLWPEVELPRLVAREAAARPLSGLVARAPARVSAVADPVKAMVASSARDDPAEQSSPPTAVQVADVTIRQTPLAPETVAPAQGALSSPIGLPDRSTSSLPDRSGASRWSGGVFAIARSSGSGGGLGSSQLGGSQIGARVAYAVGRSRRAALVARVATPVEGREREAALGVEWRPLDLPLRLFAEQRIALDGGKGGPSAGVIAGVDRPLGRGFRLEAYGQAGAIKRDRTDGFADAAARVTRRVAAVGPVAVDLGAGVWGGAQRGAARLDTGPTLGVAAPVAGRTVRLTLDWRERVAGSARPGSGPALSLGTDF